MLYNKLHDLVSGDGYQCMKTQIRSTFDEGIFGDTHADTTTINIRLSKDECEAMVQRKICGDAAPMRRVNLLVYPKNRGEIPMVSKNYNDRLFVPFYLKNNRRTYRIKPIVRD